MSLLGISIRSIGGINLSVNLHLRFISLITLLYGLFCLWLFIRVLPLASFLWVREGQLYPRFIELILFTLLALASGIIGAWRERWSRYLLYGLMSICLTVWIYHVFTDVYALLTMMSREYKLSISRTLYMGYMGVFTDAGPPLGLLALSYMSWCGSGKQDIAKETAVRMWWVFYGDLVLCSFPVFMKSFTMIIIGLKGAHDAEAWLMLGYVMFVITFPIAYVFSIFLSRALLKRSGFTEAVMAANLPLVNIVAATLCWMASIAGPPRLLL